MRRRHYVWIGVAFLLIAFARLLYGTDLLGRVAGG